MNKLLYRDCLGAIALACGLASVSAPAIAQSATTSADPFAGVTAFGQTLKNDGIYLLLGYTEDISSEISGGFKQGTMPTGELYFGTVLDLQTILGIPGASLHITFDERNGYSVNPLVGTTGPLQANSGPTRAVRLSDFFWEQAFFDDRIDIRAGRTNPTSDFMLSDVNCIFVSSIICAQPGSWYFSNSNNAYPVASWGGLLNVVPAPNVYVRAGIYDDDALQGEGNQNGFTWNTNQSTGVFVPVELGYKTDFTNARLPGKYDVGFYDDATSYTDGALHRQGRSAEWGQAQQTVWRPDTNTNQSMTLFAGGIVYNGGAPFWSQYYGGFVDRAPFGTVRPRDTITFIASYYANNQNQRPNKATQWIYELDYGFSVVPGVTLQPFAQYVQAPNNFMAPIGSKQPSNAWVVGLQVAVDFAALTSLPVFAAH